MKQVSNRANTKTINTMKYGIFNITWSEIKKQPALELEVFQVEEMTVDGSTGYIPVKGTGKYHKIAISSEIDGDKVACRAFLKEEFTKQGIDLLNIDRAPIK